MTFPIGAADVFVIEGRKKLKLGTQYLLRDKETGAHFLALLNETYYQMMLIPPDNLSYWQKHIRRGKFDQH